jgi:4a-hydroxytetrahydrobiopterin dehydratase
MKDRQVKEGKLHADFRFKDFVEAFAFITKVALVAETAQHHPHWSNIERTISWFHEFQNSRKLSGGDR